MRELFGVDITTSRKNEFADGVSYEAKKVSQELEARIESHNETAEELDDRASLPPALGIIRWLCGFYAACVAIAFIKNVGELGAKQVFNNAPWMFITGAIAGLVFLGLWIYGRTRKRGAEESCEYGSAVEDLAGIEAECRRELGIPDDAGKIDALLYRYKVKNGEIKIPEQIYGHFIRGDVYVFDEDGCFCLSDGQSRFDIPKRDIEGIDVIKKRFYMSGWAKEQNINEEPYKQFVYPNTDNLGRVWLREICVMRFRLQGDEFNFRFPGYELDTVERMSGASAERV